MSMVGNLLRVSKTELEDYLNDSSLLEDNIYNEEDDENLNLINIDKAWDGIIFLLTGQNFMGAASHPLSKILFSSQQIDEEQDLGYGPAHYLTPEQVKELNEQISKISETELAAKYDAKKMAELEVYPGIWDDTNALNYLSDYFKDVQKIYAEAAENNEAIITFLN